MKFATLKNNQKDGQVIFVSRDLKRFTPILGFQNLQNILEGWDKSEDKLKQEYENFNQSNTGKVFIESDCHSPLPRAYQWLDGSAYVRHVELVRKARGAEMPHQFWTDPLMYQGASDKFLAPHDPIEIANEAWGIDLEAEVAVITDDVPMGVSIEQALSHIKLIMLVNDVSLRNLIPDEIIKGFGFIHGKPASSFSPIAVTPDELGKHWQDCKVHLPLISKINGKDFGCPNAGIDMTFNFAQLISHGAKTRYLSAGTIIGSGTVSNNNPEVGSSCLAEKRMVEVINTGKASTPFLNFGDRITIEMLKPSTQGGGCSIFGSINQIVKKY